MTERNLRCLILAGLFGAAAFPALAQTPPATLGERYVPAPWWMREPVIASIGNVRVEIAANRARFSASFQAIDRTAAEASRKAADQVRALSRALAAYGTDKITVETSVTTRPIYDQYRDENGVMRDNTRADRIARYEATATVNLTVRDTAVLERAYATVVASQPTSIGQPFFSLQPDNAWVANLAGEAVKDARRRAQAAAADAGATLGPVRLIDPTGRACQTDVLAGWPSYTQGGGQLPTEVADVTVTGGRMTRAEFNAAPPAPPPPPPPPGGAAAPTEEQIEASRLALQPPLQTLTDQACVVYGLS